jgi:RNA polymerase sigma-70 factor, ECF subfamily
MIFLTLPDLPTEDQLLSQAIAGSQAAVMQIYESYYVPVYQYIRMRVDDRMAAEDLASEVFVRMIDAINGKNPPRQSLRGWLFQVARFVLHDHYGELRKLPSTVLDEWISDDQQPEVDFIRKMDFELLRQGIATLNAEQQEVLVLRFGQMLNLQETADVMGKSYSIAPSKTCVMPSVE